MNNSKCRITDPNARLRVSDNRSYVEMVSDHGCTSCGGTSLSWKDYALSKWKGNVLDSSHDIPELRLPGVTATATAQQGIDTEGNILTNNGTLRVLIDPIINSNPRTRNAAKFAYLADIRIINGVWYLKDPLNNSSWPGTPIWSDHPGNFQTTNEEGIEDSMNVGQSQLRTLHSWPATPKYFSYYEYDEAQSRLSGDGFGTVSYGNLFRETISGKPHWVPGHWVSNNLKMFCPNNESCTNCSSSIAKATTAMTCAGGSTLHNSVGLLNATRGGFLNGHAHGAKNGSSTSARQLPVNFDIEQFQQALQQTAPGELGSYFGPGKYMNRNFNGIVYIANTWKDSLRGLDGTSTSAPWPPQGSQNDPLQAGDGVANPAPVQRALPFQLCSSSLAGTNYDGPNGGFVIPNCASYNYSGPGGATSDARPNSIRVINGQNLDATLLPKGLTVATNLPLYVQGDFNTSSDVSNRNATPWVSTLMASDFLGHLSNSWDDNFSSCGKNYAQRDASNTTYNHSILTGVTQRAKSGGGTRETAGLNTITRYNEDWSSATQTINGSIVIGFNSVYFTFANVCCSINTYQPPTRKWNYDEHLLSYGKQPPGSPAFFIYAVESWRSGD